MFKRKPGKTALAATTVSAGVFIAAQALASLPGLELTPQLWEFIFWAIGAGGGGSAVMMGKEPAATPEGEK